MSPKKVQGLVLVVDDVEANRFLAQAFLEMIGWKVEVVNQADTKPTKRRHSSNTRFRRPCCWTCACPA